MTARTFAIGDIHGDLAALETMLARLPPVTAADTIVLLGDYVDRGPDSKGVVDRVRALPRELPARVVALRGNHEDMWLKSWESPDLTFLIPPGNGCARTYRSFAGREIGDIGRYFEVASWMPRDVRDWMESLPLWFEDAHAIYVHAGLEGEGVVWRHPRESEAQPLLWMREPDFYANYEGKRVVFGHTPVLELPDEAPGSPTAGDPTDVWMQGHLIGVDTGCGKGGFLSALELPAMRVYESR